MAHKACWRIDSGDRIMWKTRFTDLLSAIRSVLNLYIHSCSLNKLALQPSVVLALLIPYWCFSVPYPSPPGTSSFLQPVCGITQLLYDLAVEVFCKRTGKRDETPYVEAFMLLHQEEKESEDCHLMVQRSKRKPKGEPVLQGEEGENENGDMVLKT